MACGEILRMATMGGPTFLQPRKSFLDPPDSGQILSSRPQRVSSGAVRVSSRRLPVSRAFAQRPESLCEPKPLVKQVKRSEGGCDGGLYLGDKIGSE